MTHILSSTLTEISDITDSRAFRSATFSTPLHLFRVGNVVGLLDIENSEGRSYETERDFEMALGKLTAARKTAYFPEAAIQVASRCEGSDSGGARAYSPIRSRPSSRRESVRRPVILALGRAESGTSLPHDMPDSRNSIGCVISAGPDDETHPRQVVVNALIRRGLEPQDTKRGILLFNHGVPNRQGFGPAQTLQFATRVEAYD